MLFVIDSPHRPHPQGTLGPASPRLTQHGEVSAPHGRGDTAAAQDGLALIVAGVAGPRAGDGEAAAEVADTAAEGLPIFLPDQVQFDQGPGRDRGWGLSIGRLGLSHRAKCIPHIPPGHYAKASVWASVSPSVSLLGAMWGDPVS